MTRPLQVAIVGYGIGGIAASIHLRRLGYDITHFDRNDPPAVMGGGMLLHPPAQRELRELGVLESAVACGAPVRRITAQSARGRALFEMGYSDVAGDYHGLGIQRSTLHRLLSCVDRGRAEVVCGSEIADVDAQVGMLVEASGQRCGPFDLIVVADGANSVLRSKLSFPERRNQRSDSAALVALLEDPDGYATDRLVQHFDGARHVSVWPVGSDIPNGINRCSVAMNISQNEVRSLCMDGHWQDHVSSLCPGIGELLLAQPQVSPYVFSYRDVELVTCAIGRVVLIGDAAHSMSPQLGVGAQLAMQDAALLARVLAEQVDVPSALSAYSRTRPMQLSRYQEASRWLTPLFQSNNRLLSHIRDRALGSAMRMPIVKQFARQLLA